MSSNTIYPYVYRASNSLGQFYIGFRKANKVNASDDIGKKYFSSSNIILQNVQSYNFTVIAEFFDYEDAFKFEQELIADNIRDPLCLNKCVFLNLSGRSHFISDQVKKAISVKASWKNDHARRKAQSERFKLLMTGKPLSEEHRRNISIGSTAANSPPRRCCCIVCHRHMAIDALSGHYNSHFDRETHSKLCENCNVVIKGNSNYSQHHGDNCKLAPGYTPKPKRVYTRTKVSCICCRVTRNLPEHTMHINKIQSI